MPTIQDWKETLDGKSPAQAAGVILLHIEGLSGQHRPSALSDALAAYVWLSCERLYARPLAFDEGISVPGHVFRSVRDVLKPTRSTIGSRPMLDSTANPLRVPMQQQERHRPRFEDSPRDVPHGTLRNPED